ncbi:MAG: hypothetical protein KQH83_10245 [Actinobacteria bacterium]|nr:hypothetical protein [Actinomycetota bacterium]
MPIGRLKPEQQRRFLAYLDGLPEHERPVYGLTGSKGSSSWTMFRPIAATTTIAALFFADRVVFSQETWGKGSTEVPIADIAGIEVKQSVLDSKVRFRLADGGKIVLNDVMKKASQPLSAYGAMGMAAFDPSRLSDVAMLYFYRACDMAMDLPEGLLSGA